MRRHEASPAQFGEDRAIWLAQDYAEGLVVNNLDAFDIGEIGRAPRTHFRRLDGVNDEFHVMRSDGHAIAPIRVIADVEGIG